MYHVAAEITLFGGLFYYVSKKNNELRQQLYELEQEIEEIIDSDDPSSSSNDLRKAYQLQEKSKSDYEQIQAIKKQLSNDVQELQAARDLHAMEQTQIQHTYEEKIRELQQKRDELAEAQRKHEINLKQIAEREKQLVAREKLLKNQPMSQMATPMAPMSMATPMAPMHMPMQPMNTPNAALMGAAAAVSVSNTNTNVASMHLPDFPRPISNVKPLSSSPMNTEVQMGLNQNHNRSLATEQFDQFDQTEEYEDNFNETDNVNDEIDDEIDAELQKMENMDSIRSKHSRSKSKSKGKRTHSRSRSRR